VSRDGYGRAVRPVLFTLFGVPVGGYAVFVALGFVIAFAIRRVERRRLGFSSDPRHRWVGLGALVGAVVGAKAGMLLFEPLDAVGAMLERMASLDFSGKTVVGALIGGYLGVELTKKIVGIRHSTGDGFAVALPVAQGVGRVGCLLHGCCYGVPWDGAWSVFLHGAARHPSQLYEAVLDLALAAWLWSIRERPRPAGHLFRRYLVGYALIRFVVEFFRGDPVNEWGPLTSVQWICLAAAAGFGFLIWRGERAAS
jgi:phosphatidylglycerol:prolipoprotein diacylglycerol transferase